MHPRIGIAAAALVVALSLPAAAMASPWIGYYVPGTVPAGLAAVEAAAGGGAQLSLTFQGPGYFAGQAVEDARASGHVPLYTLELWDYAKGVAQPAWDLASFARGDHDDALRSWAIAAKASGVEIWLRPFHEMNGDWYPWGGTANGNSPADFVPAWRHVVDTIRAAGADNVKFVWCPNAESVPDTAANAIPGYWPGDGYVDYLAIDGYNFGGSWASFLDVFARPYATVTGLSDRPLFVAETACSDTGGDKASWIAAMFRSVPASFPRITGITWFQADKEHDWRFDSDAASAAAWRAGVASWSGPSPYRAWLSRLSGTASLTAHRRSPVYLRGTLRRDDGKPQAGRTVTLYRKSGTKWARVGSSRTSVKGTYSFRQAWDTRGTRYYRVVFAGYSTATDRCGTAARGYTLRIR